ncbi:hypothetical protein JCM10213_003408 [Rhodosporidiobolus nylandii]
MGVPWSTLFALVAVALSVYAFLPSPPPSSAPPHPLRGASYTSPGPVLASSVANLALDGLTVIPITRLPRLKTRLSLPFDLLPTQSLHLSLALTTSETVLPLLRVSRATVRGRDLTRQPVSVDAEGVAVEMRASVGVRVEISWEKKDEAGRWAREKTWRKGAAGRVELALSGASLSAAAQVVAGPSPSRLGEPQPTALSPRLSLLSTSLSPGVTSSLSLSPSFLPFLPASWASSLLAHLLPLLRNASPTRHATSALVAFLLRELAEGRVVDELLADLGTFAAEHVDGSLYAGVAEDERDEVLASFFPSAAATVEREPSSRSPAPDAPLRLSALLHGPTLLLSLPLPPPPSRLLPIFASSTGRGLRHAVLSSPLLNQITTGPPAVELGESGFERLAWGSARVELLEGTEGGGERELQLSVEHLSALLRTDFSISSTLRTAPSLLLGGTRDLLTPGSTTTTVTSPSLSVFLPLSFSPSHPQGWRIEVAPRPPSVGLRAKERGVRLEGEFAEVSPRVRMESRLLGRVGEKVVNAVLEGVKVLLLPLLSPPLLSFFLADLARLRLQEVLDDVCGRVRDEGGVEFAVEARKGEEEGEKG